MDLMIEQFSPQHVTPDLARFILAKYTHHEVIVLIDMLNNHLMVFHSWLKKLRKKSAENFPAHAEVP